MAKMPRLAKGAQKLGIQLTPHQTDQFETYYQELTDWNQRMNLTAITDYDEVQLKHFLDSLTVTLAWPEKPETKLIDVGTGAGIPGIPLKIAFPDIRLVLLDATAKKAAFLEHIIGKLGLRNVMVVVGRAEEMAHQTEFREKFDLVLSRGVAALPALVELTLPFCAIGGCFIAQKKGAIEHEIRRAARAITLMGGRLHEIRAIALAEFADQRQLVVIDKVSPTPPAYPRRPGMPAKKPIL